MERGRKMQQEAAKEKVHAEGDTEKSKLKVASLKPDEDAAGDVQGTKTENVPFVKSEPLWSVGESLEPFKKWPQKPYFRPVQKLDDESTKAEFSNKVKKTDNGLLETLGELEENGFGY